MKLTDILSVKKMTDVKKKGRTPYTFKHRLIPRGKAFYGEYVDAIIEAHDKKFNRKKHIGVLIYGGD